MRYLILLISILVSACGVQLRKPFCTESLSEVPAELVGKYEVVAPSSSVAWSGNMIIKSISIEISNKSLSLSKAIPGAPDTGQICRVNGRIFSENENQDGTFSLSEISKFDQGLIISLFSLDLDLAAKLNYKTHYFPRLAPDIFNNGVLTQENDIGLTQSKFVLDNSNLTQEQVLKVLKPISYQTVFRTQQLREKNLTIQYKIGSRNRTAEKTVNQDL